MELFACGRNAAVRQPIRIVVDANGRLLVLGEDRSRIRLLDARGEYLSDLALPSVPAKAVFGALATDTAGNLYVGENESGQVLVYDASLNLRLRLGTHGDGPGEFQSIAGIASDKDFIYVADSQVTAVQVFDRKGDFVRGWGKHDMGVQNFSLPSGIAVDSKGRVVVVDALRHEIKVFDRDGNFIDRFGGLGSRLGQVAFPADVAIDAEDRIYVADKGNSRVQVFELIDNTSLVPERKESRIATENPGDKTNTNNTDREIKEGEKK
jgi:DNA-binding beta-propeller fold protein YncE